MFCVDRQRFIDYALGDLFMNLDRNIVAHGDDIRHEEAEARMEAGETIGLTDQGVIVSTMAMEDGVFVERIKEK